MIKLAQNQQDGIRFLGGVSRPCDILPPLVLSTNGTTALKVFDANEYQGRDLFLLTLQNVHNNILFWSIDQDNCSATDFHGILKAGTATKDGTGGEVDLTKLKPKRNVYVFSATAGIVCVRKAFIAIR